ncbi:hypothetical protein OPKNFCMD_3021 [Methylobacterium crusticola]|uniref:Uncharacterized protein n=1 Tax=Methylobacterium crusticola TaxID=1697972 RepID=A0ABQ4QYF8_9HYPH|nr:hypothetical protein [Methylobacterium crusticola]GJD50283.1 hypothetical protein OPKNFCMD_3021 [Methylobacterium crusticola]
MVEFVPMAEAAGFTAGCVAIHAARQWAGIITPILTYMVFALVVCLFVVIGIQHAADPTQVMESMTQAMVTF